MNSADTEAKETSKEVSILSVLREWKYLKVIMLAGIVKIGGNLIFYGIAFVINDVGVNFGINSLLLGAG